MTNERNALASLFAACHEDHALKARLLEYPRAVLADHGINVADDVSIQVLENSNDCINITIPAPPEEVRELSDLDLMMVSGGGRGNARGGEHAPWSMLGCVTKVCGRFDQLA